MNSFRQRRSMERDRTVAEKLQSRLGKFSGGVCAGTAIAVAFETRHAEPQPTHLFDDASATHLHVKRHFN